MPGLQNNLRKLRQNAGLTQQGLAEQAGVSRQAYCAVESGSATPSTEVALRLARALGTAVEELFYLPQDAPGPVLADLVETALDESAASSPRRARMYRVGQRLLARPLLGREGVRYTLAPAEATVTGEPAGPGQVSILPFGHDDLDTPTLAISGCDPAMELLEQGLRGMGVRMVAKEEGSRQALLGLARGEAHVAGCHLWDDATGTFNGAWVRRLVPFPCRLVNFASWQQGLIVAPGNPKGISGLESLTDPRLAIVNRHAGSGSRALLDRFLRNAGIPSSAIRGYQREESGHLAVAAAIANGRADAGIGVKAAAVALGLDFVPLEDESYDLVIPDYLLDEMPVQALLTLLGKPVLRRKVESLGGYDVANMGSPSASPR